MLFTMTRGLEGGGLGRMRERGERGHVEGGRSRPRLRVSAVPG